jgi:hypothetical protein
MGGLAAFECFPLVHSCTRHRAGGRGGRRGGRGGGNRWGRGRSWERWERAVVVLDDREAVGGVAVAVTYVLVQQHTRIECRYPPIRSAARTFYAAKSAGLAAVMDDIAGVTAGYTAITCMRVWVNG